MIGPRIWRGWGSTGAFSSLVSTTSTAVAFLGPGADLQTGITLEADLIYEPKTIPYSK